MSAAATAPDAAPDLAALLPDEDAPFHRDTLRRLIDMGMDIADTVHRQAATEPGAAPALALAFDRVARAVRGAVALAHKIAQPGARHAGAQPADARPPPPRIGKPLQNALRRRLDGDGDAYARLSDAQLAELNAYLASLDPTGAYPDTPLPDLIAAICRDLGWDDSDVPAMADRVANIEDQFCQAVERARIADEAWRAEYPAIKARLDAAQSPQWRARYGVQAQAGADQPGGALP